MREICPLAQRYSGAAAIFSPRDQGWHCPYHAVSLGSHLGTARRDICRRVCAADRVLRLAHPAGRRFKARPGRFGEGMLGSNAKVVARSASRVDRFSRPIGTGRDRAASPPSAGHFQPCSARSLLAQSREKSFMKLTPIISGALVAAMLLPSAAFAQSVSENTNWQFDTSADKVNKAYLEDMRQRRRNGYYSPPVNNTYIDRQYNCSVSASAVGNSSSSSAVANSPSTSGHSSAATGNDNSTTTSSGYGSGSGSTSADQNNSGSVDANTSGDQSTSVRGDNQQALNTDQTNSGDQTASVAGSTACQYGALN